MVGGATAGAGPRSGQVPAPIRERLGNGWRLPAASGGAAVFLAAAAATMGWATPAQGGAFAAAVALAAVLAALERRRAVAVLAAEVARHREIEQEARTANRAKSDFLANMSHELRTPLATVVGTADLLLAAELPPGQRRHVETLAASADALLALIDDVLDFAKLEAGRLRLETADFRLLPLVAGVRDLVAPRAEEKGLELTADVDPGVPDELRGDPSRLRQVLLNLAGNAVKFTSEGRVAIRVTSEETTDGAKRLCFAVRDTGIGISAADQRRIFETFYQADSSATRRAGGSGLGLAISRELVERMGGEIGLTSERGAGSTFWFHLPLVVAEGEVPGEPTATVPSTGRVDRGRRRVLVVDDHGTNRNLALGHLELLGYRAAGAASGEEALALIAEARAAGEPFDAVLMDCQMPELDGYETTRRLRRQESATGGDRTPVVAVTAHALPGEREKCLAVGMDDYLVKPYRGADLGRVLDRWLAGGPPAEGAADREDAGDGDAASLLEERVAALRRLGEHTGRDALGQAIADYRREGPQLLESMRQALDAGDAGALERAAHTLAGSSAMLGAARLVPLLRDIESRALGGVVEGLEEPLRRAGDEHGRFVETLQRLFRQ